MSEIVSSTCPQCGAEMPAASTARVCPRCAAAFLKADPTEISGQPTASPRPFTPPPVAELAPLFPQLEILELIGQGGMGAVYKARQKELDRVVALKILPPGVGDAAFAERFAREAKALARLNHPGIVTLYEFGRTNGLFFFLMEFVDGATLRQVLRGGRISPREALAIVPAICDALQYAHDQGIVHRDIKPENILLDRRGRTKVADFGLAKLMESGGADSSRSASEAASTVTHAGKVLGTPQYMAPEQAEHPATVDHRADIYALGVVFYQMLTGELPAQRIQPPSQKVHIDVRLDEIVLRALEKNPDRRYAHASALKTDVETIAGTEEPTSASPSIPPSTVAEQNTIPELVQLLVAPAGQASQRAARIQAVEKNIVLPLRVLTIVILGYYFLFSGWLPTKGLTSPMDWTLNNAVALKAVFIAYAILSLAVGVIFIRIKRLSLAKIQWMVFALGMLDAVMLGTLTLVSKGFDSLLYWFFLALILHNALAMPGALPQLALNLFVSSAFMFGGILDRRWIHDLEGREADPQERMIVLVAWALCCCVIRVLLEKQQLPKPEVGPAATATPSSACKTNTERMAAARDKPGAGFPRSKQSEAPSSRPVLFQPANWLLLVALWNFFMVMIYYVSRGHVPWHLTNLPDTLSIVYGPLRPFVAVAGLVSILGAWRMRTYRDLTLGKVAAAICMVVPPGLVIGLPVGLWVWRRLKSPQVRSAFEARAREQESQDWPGDPLTPLAAWLGMLVTVCMAWLFLIIACTSPTNWSISPMSGGGTAFGILTVFVLPLVFISVLAPIAGWLAWDGVGWPANRDGTVQRAVVAATCLPLIYVVGMILGPLAPSGQSPLTSFFRLHRIAGVLSIVGCFGIAWLLAVTAEKHRARLFARGSRLQRRLGCITPLLTTLNCALVAWILVPPSLSPSPVIQVSTTTVRMGDIGVRLNSLGTVEASNSVTFAVAEDSCQEVIRKFDAHQTLTVEASNSHGERFGHGFLSGVDNLIDTSTGTLKCKATLIPDGTNLMVPGLFVNISLLLEVKHGVTLVPTADIHRDPQSAFVWVIQPDHTVTQRPVSVGTTDGEWTEIQTGLSPGEIVASDGFNFLAEGQKVRSELVPKTPRPSAGEQ